MRTLSLTLFCVCVVACKQPAPPSNEASPLPSAATVATIPGACEASCGDGFCWDDCPSRVIAPRGGIFAVAVAGDSVAWVDKQGAHQLRRGGGRTDYANAGAPIAVRGDLLVFGDRKGMVSFVRGGAEHSVKLPKCRDPNEILIGDGRVAIRCVDEITDDSGGPGLGAILSMLTDFIITDADGKVLGNSEFSKSPRMDSMNTVFALRGEHVITNDNERIVELDLVTKKPFMKQIATLPKGYVVGGGVAHGAGFDLFAWNCASHSVEGCPGEVDEELIHVEGARTETRKPPGSQMLDALPIDGSARVLRSDRALYRAAGDKFAALVSGTKNILYASVAHDGTSAVVTDEGLTVRARTTF